jgi:alkylation response protein AidB-like acyl-CoA dehydrogenase
MIDLDRFRERCRAFLARPVEHSDDAWAAGVAFQRRLHDAGLAGITVPVEYGGQGLTADHLEVLNAEAAGMELPVGVFTITIGMCVPVLLRHGTEQQKRRHVPPMLRGDEIWCQLFSEPNAGSDVAAAQTRAVRDGDEWVLTGQKVWTSSAERARYGMCIARTDVDVPKHRGLTMFAVPMDRPGITVRPLVQATGAAGFNEVFLDSVRLPLDAVVGEPGQGWTVTLSMLMNERVSLGASGNSLVSGRTGPVLASARVLGGDRQALADLHTREEVLRFVALRVRSAGEAGREPGPVGSIAKLVGSDLVRRAADEHLRMRGPAGTAWEPGDADGEAAARDVVMAPSFAIAGGTSEIQRTIIGERVLGLPREPATDKDVPFREVLQNRPPS